MHYPKSENKSCSHKSNNLEKICTFQGHTTDDIFLNDYLTVDDKLIVADYPTDEDILSSFHETGKEIGEPEEVKEAENISNSSKKDVQKVFVKISCGLQFAENILDEVLVN